MKELIVLWDGDCGFCSKCLQWYKDRKPQGIIRYLSFHNDEAITWRKKIGIEILQQSIVVLEDEDFYCGDKGIRLLLQRIPKYRWISTLMGIPLIKQLSHLLYRAIANNRYRLRKHSCKKNN